MIVDTAFEIALEEAAAARDDGASDWADIVYQAMVNSMLTAASEEQLIPLIREHFAGWRLGDNPEIPLAAVLSNSPVMADRASIALQMCEEPVPPAVVASSPGIDDTWFTVYDDGSLLDPDWVPWIDWRDFVDAVDYADGPPCTVYLVARTPAGARIKRDLDRMLTNLWYLVD